MNLLCVGFSTTDAVLSRIIRWFTKSPVSHAWILYHDHDMKMDMVLEATLTGVRIVPYDNFVKHSRVVCVFPAQAMRPGFEAIGKWLGAHYDVGGLIGMAYVLLGRALKRKWRNPLRSTGALFCSELVAVAMKASKMPDTETWVPDRVDPDMLYKYFSRHIVRS